MPMWPTKAQTYRIITKYYIYTYNSPNSLISPPISYSLDAGRKGEKINNIVLPIIAYGFQERTCNYSD